MARAKRDEQRRWTASQVVAHNLTRARELRGLTQVEVAERLSRFTGARWSQATVAQAEGSVGGQRIRQFTANELVALARVFDLPLVFFFLPPDDGEGRLATTDARTGLPWEYLLVLLLGHRGNLGALAERTANWAHVRHRHVEVPASDVLEDDETIRADVLRLLRAREPVLPEDVLAAAFHGLAARRMRGARRPGKDVEAFAQNLRGLADALEAFSSYRPGVFVDETVVGEIAAERRQAAEDFRRAFAKESQEVEEEDDE